MITKINRNECTNIREAIVNALKDVENNLGIDINLGSGRFDEDCLTFSKVSCKVRGSKSQEQKDLDWFLTTTHDFDNIDFDKVFSYQGKKFKVSGYNLKARVNCWNVVDTVSNKKYKIDSRTLKAWFTKDKASCE